MASGDLLAVMDVSANEPPTSNYATLDTRGTDPTAVLDFDTTTQEAAFFKILMPAHYSGGGITVGLVWAATSATSGTIGWDVAINRWQNGVDTIASSSFATAATVTAATVPGTAGIVTYSTVNISNGANMDSLAATEAGRIRVRRDVSNDTAAGDAELLMVVLFEQ